MTSHRSINRRYATLAEELGLDVAHLDPIGWSATSVPDPTAARYADMLAELEAALVLWRRAERTSPAGPVRAGAATPGLLLWLWPADPGGPLGPGVGHDPVWRLRPALRARG